MDKEYAKKIINKTTDDYNRIATLWSTKRWRLPDDISDLTNDINTGDKILDLGCGNGYLYDPVIQQGGKYTGADVSKNQIIESKKKHPDGNFVLSMPLELPFDDSSFDKVFCLSTIHHIPSEDFQTKFLDEIARVLNNGGVLYLTAWNLTGDPSREFEKIDNEGNILYPFKDSGGKVLADRFIHTFTLDELQGKVKQSGFNILDARVVTRGYGKFSNNLVVAQKLS